MLENIERKILDAKRLRKDLKDHLEDVFSDEDFQLNVTPCYIKPDSSSKFASIVVRKIVDTEFGFTDEFGNKHESPPVLGMTVKIMEVELETLFQTGWNKKELREIEERLKKALDNTELPR